MTFPAGGGSTPAGGQPMSSAATPNPDTPTPTPQPASGAEEQVVEQPGTGADAPAAPPSTPKVERPASFREALDRARGAASASEGEPTPEPKPAEAPAKPEPKKETAPAAAPNDTPEVEEPKPAERPAPKKDAAPPTPKVEKPTAPKTEAAADEPDADVSDSDEDDDEALVEAAGKGEREAFEERFSDPDKGKKSALDFAHRMARKNSELRPIAELVEKYGGIEGAKLPFEYADALVNLSRPTATAEEAFEQAEGFREFLWKNAPGAAAKLESSIFWNAVQDTPEGQANVQALVDEIFGDGVLTVEQVKMLGNAFADGQIDLDDLAERADYTKTKAEREAAARGEAKKSKREQELEARLAKLEGKETETEDAKATARKAQVASAFNDFVTENFKTISPILREYGFSYPDNPESPEFKSMARRIRHIQRDLEEAMESDEDYRAVVANIANLQTDGVHSIQQGTVRNKMRVALRGILDELAPEAAAEIKRKNRLVADRVKQNGKSSTTTAPARPAAAAPARSSSAPNSERAIADVDDARARRSDSFRRALDEGRRSSAEA